MDKAQRILMLVGGIVSIVWGVIFSFIVIPVFVVLIGLGDGEEAAYGWYFVIMYIATIVNIIVAFMGKNTKSKGLLVTNIIFGFLSGITVNAVGGIIGLIGLSKDNQQNA